MLIWFKIISGIIFVLFPGFALKDNFKKHPFLSATSIVIGLFLLYISLDPLVKMASNDNNHEVSTNDEVGSLKAAIANIQKEIESSRRTREEIKILQDSKNELERKLASKDKVKDQEKQYGLIHKKSKDIEVISIAKPKVSERDGNTHRHGNREHSHPLPTSGINHTHSNNIETNTKVALKPSVSSSRPPIRKPDGSTHWHANKKHTHPLPATGTSHTHSNNKETTVKVTTKQHQSLTRNSKPKDRVVFFNKRVKLLLPHLVNNKNCSSEFNVKGVGTINDFMHKAAFSGEINAIKKCLMLGTPVDLKDRNNWTPLHSAVFSKQHEIIKLLVSKGANIHAVAADSKTPLDLAKLYRDNSILSLLQDTNN